jgi:hypothetical protein
MSAYKIKLTFTQPILVTIPKDPDIYAGYIAQKAALTDEALAEELASVEKIEEKGWTGFHKVNGQPIIYDYVLKGFFKDACSMLRRVPGTKSEKLTAFKKIIDGLVFVEPRQIPLNFNGAGMGVLERPLRAQTAQGERVTLARSDTCPAGTTMEFTIEILGGLDEKTLREWLNYGKRRGLGQWRNGGYGSFTYEMEEVI